MKREMIRNKYMGMGRLSAREQLAVRRDYLSLAPGLCARGLSVEDALAVAHNATVIFYAMAVEPAFSSPDEVLSRFSLEEIAQYAAEFELVQNEDVENSWNNSFEEGKV